MGDDRPTAYRDLVDGVESSIYRASGSGQCVKALAAAMQGRRPSRYESAEEILNLAAAEGNMHELVVIDQLREQGHRIEDQQPEVMLKIIPRVYIRGHIDGLGYPPRARQQRLYEVKTMSDSVFAKWRKYGSMAEALVSDEFRRYGWQVSIYMHATGLKCIYVVKNRSSGKVEIEELTVPPIPLPAIRRRIIEAEKWRKRDPELPVCDVAASEKYFCPYPYLHDEDEGFAGDEPDDEAPPIDDVTAVVLEGLCTHHQELTKVIRQGDAANKERREVNGRILEAMGEGVGERMAGKYEVKRVPVAGRKALNPASLARLLNDAGYEISLADLETLIEEAQVRGAGYEYPKVTIRKDSK